MSHDVEIDQTRLDAVFDAYAAQPTMAPGQDLMPYQEPEESQWLATLVFAFGWLNQYAPNWGVPDDKVQELAEKGAAMMDQIFPFGPGSPERLPPWAQFLVCLGGIVVMYGFDFQTMTLKPLTPPEPEPDDVDKDPVDYDWNKKPATNTGKFSTMGSPDDEQ